MNKIKMLIVAIGMLFMAGCAIFENPLFWRITVGGVLRAAYDAGGAQLVGEKIDSLEEKGKIDAEQAEKIKEAAQKGYDKLQEKLTEEKVDDIVLEDEDLDAE